jgi:hypothetical protein
MFKTYYPGSQPSPPWGRGLWSLYIWLRRSSRTGNHPGATAPPLLIQEGSSYKLPSSDEEGWRPGRRSGAEQETATHSVPLAGNLATVKPLQVARVKPAAYLHDSYGREM